MAKYREISNVEVEAVRLHRCMTDIPEWFDHCMETGDIYMADPRLSYYVGVHCKDGFNAASLGDWIVFDPKTRELKIIRGHCFDKTYEKVKEQTPAPISPVKMTEAKLTETIACGPASLTLKFEFQSGFAIDDQLEGIANGILDSVAKVRKFKGKTKKQAHWDACSCCSECHLWRQDEPDTCPSCGSTMEDRKTKRSLQSGELSHCDVCGTFSPAILFECPVCAQRWREAKK